MNFTAQRIPYRQTGSFSKVVLDYIDHAAELRKFYGHPPTLKGMKAAMAERKSFTTDRAVLVKELHDQYAGIAVSEEVKKNIDLLLEENSFTITTAHQPNLFTGPLFFIYKILHAIRLADFCKKSFPGKNFVPVFYMGSEDADLDELGHCWLEGEKFVWETGQKGAVGRMKIDKALTGLVDRMEGQLGVLPYGEEIIRLVRSCYEEGRTVQEATLHFLNSLFGEFGLLVLIADRPALKKRMQTVFEDDLLNQSASGIVSATAEKLEKAGYKVQAHPREINLFYLKDDLRNRIEWDGYKFTVLDTDIRFTKQEMIRELEENPGHFSPNVILRGLFQETILPNIAFIGGGGELAYWLQLKELFAHYKTPYPVLVLRNSFMVVEDKWKQKINKTGFKAEDYFMDKTALMNRFVTNESRNELSLNGTLSQTEQVFDAIKEKAAAVDPGLAVHTEALKTQALKKLRELEKKMFRAEKRKFNEQERQIADIRQHLFPGGVLQERIDNFISYHARLGKGFFRELLTNSLSLEQEFVILS